jgi:hypothetical protein
MDYSMPNKSNCTSRTAHLLAIALLWLALALLFVWSMYW